MDLVRLGITNFRNLSGADEVELPAGGLLVAAAPNAVGKTNFLESVAVLMRGKSFRARIDECVRWGEDNFLLEGMVEHDGEGSHQVAVRYHRPSRKMRIEEDGAPASVVAFYARYPLVLFLPEDTFLMSRGPAQRRNYINQVLVSHPQYMSALVQYHRVLKQRNAGLKRVGEVGDIQAWTELLVEHASVLWRHRENFATFLDSQLTEIYRQISNERRSLNTQLSLGVGDRDNYMAELEAVFRHEKRYGYTLYGPHRDDLAISSGDRSAAVSLSRGQMRSLVIALKVAAHRYIRQITKKEPILLLDDVFSELDEERQVALLENLPHTQTILTCTTVPSALRKRDDVYLLDLRAMVRGVREKKPKQKKEEGEVEIKTGQKVADQQELDVESVRV